MNAVVAEDSIVAAIGEGQPIFYIYGFTDFYNNVLGLGNAAYNTMNEILSIVVYILTGMLRAGRGIDGGLTVAS